jgi:threonine/homoserine/homoserine lactone efflux protein
MYGAISEGFVYGLMLAIMIGPIFVALVQTGIEKGFRAGVTVGLGIWISDLIIIGTCISLMGNNQQSSIDDNAKHWGGILGGTLMIMFGLASMFKTKVPDLNKPRFNAKSVIQLWIKGFVVNTLNPFTFIFWIGLVSAYILGKKASIAQSMYFFGTIMITIITTDLLKIYAAKKIRSKLTVHNLMLVSKIAGIFLIAFGIVLILRTW